MLNKEKCNLYQRRGLCQEEESLGDLSPVVEIVNVELETIFDDEDPIVLDSKLKKYK